MQIGIDLVELESMAKLLRYENSLKKIFTARELELVKGYGEQKRLKSLAGRFAVKEAAAKALGTGFGGGFSLTDLETLNDANGRPVLNLHNKARELALELGVPTTRVSISYSGNSAVAMVLLE